MPAPMVSTAYVTFATEAEPSLTVAGKLVIPLTEDNAGGRQPAIVICHGSDGVDGRGEYYASALHALGLATLEIDMWAARGSVRGAAARPRSPIETLPDASTQRLVLACASRQQKRRPRIHQQPSLVRPIGALVRAPTPA